MLDSPETILRHCAAAEPDPWYPSQYVQATGTPRDQLDPSLDQLRMAGLIQLTDWVQGRGQGYALTPEGKRLLESPRDLARLRAGELPNYRPRLEQLTPADERPITTFERGEAIREAFLHPSPPIVSYTLIAINILWFLWGIAIALQHGEKLNNFLYGSTNEVLIQTGALSGVYLVESWWGWGRLLTCCFVHIGLLHLGVNMYSLWVVGPFFEQLWGRGRFLVLYLIAGLGGSCAMVINNPHSIGAGASGALWGILAAHAVWIVANRRYLPGAIASQMLRQVFIVLVINIGITFGVPNISAAAHFGGGVVGAVTALLLQLQRFGSGLWRRLALVGLVALPFLCLGAVAESERVDPRWQTLQLQALYQKPLLEAWRLHKSVIEPLQKQRLKGYSLETVKEAIGALQEVRAYLSEGREQLRRLGPFRDPALERERSQRLNDLDADIDQVEREELGEFLEPFLGDTIRRAKQLYVGEGAKFDALDENQRTSEAVETLIAPCREARLQLEAAVELVRQIGPFQNPILEKHRRKELDDGESTIEDWKRMEERWRAKAKQPPRSQTE